MWVIRIVSDYIIGSSIILNRPFVYFDDIKIAMIAFFTYYCMKNKNVALNLLGMIMIGVHLIIFIYILYNGKLNTSAYTFFWENNNSL